MESHSLHAVGVFRRLFARSRGGVAVPVPALFLALAVASPAPAQDPQAATNLARPELRAPAAAPRAAVGSVVRAPRAAHAGPDAPKPQLICDFVCDPYAPGHVIARIAFPERLAQSAQVRLDVAAGTDALQQGDFGSVPLRAVPEARLQPGTKLEAEQVRARVEPVYFDNVRDHRVVPRDPALEPQRLKQFQRMAPAVAAAQAPADLREALERDARLGAIEQMRVIVEGMQPGLAYEIRLVDDSGGEAERLDENLCPVPVCPADYRNP